MYVLVFHLFHQWKFWINEYSSGEFGKILPIQASNLQYCANNATQIGKYYRKLLRLQISINNTKLFQNYTHGDMQCYILLLTKFSFYLLIYSTVEANSKQSSNQYSKTHCQISMVQYTDKSLLIQSSEKHQVP